MEHWSWQNQLQFTCISCQLSFLRESSHRIDTSVNWRLLYLHHTQMQKTAAGSQPEQVWFPERARVCINLPSRPQYP